MKSKINIRALGAVSTILLVIYLILGCAAKKQFWGDAENGYNLRYRIPKGVTLNYEAKVKQITNQEMMGQTMEIVNTVKNNYSVSGVDVDEQRNLVTSVKMDSISIHVKNPRGEQDLDASEIVGKDFGMIFSDVGKKIEFNDPESIQVEFVGGSKRTAESFFRNMLPVLSNEPVKIGESWKVTEVDSMKEGGLDVVVDAVTTSTLVGTETIDEMDCFKIEAKTTATVEGSGNQMGANLYLEGDSEGNSVWYFAYKKGIFVKATTDMLMEGTVTVSGPSNMTIPITQETKVDVELVK